MLKDELGHLRLRVSYYSPVSMVEQPAPPSLRSFTVDDERLAEARPRLSAEEFALDDVRNEEWEAFHAAIARA